MKQPLYLDYAATTPMDPRVFDCMKQYLMIEGTFGNPASRSHRYGWQAEEAVDIARHQVADCLQCDARDIVWTSGATEANNLAIKGIAEYFDTLQKNDLKKDTLPKQAVVSKKTVSKKTVSKKHLITLKTEHKAVLDCMVFLQSKGWQVTYLQPQNNGLLDIETLTQAINDETALVSIMWVNNETGVIQDIPRIAQLCQEKQVLLHVDAAQAVGKVAIDLSKVPVDLLSVSGHKIYGPKGIGCLFVRRQVAHWLKPQIHGGGHESGLRSGTLPTHQIVAMGKACAILHEELNQEKAHLAHLKQGFLRGCQSLPNLQINGAQDACSDHMINLSFEQINSETLLVSLHTLALSTGSACNSETLEPSHVLLGMGLERQRAESALRISWGRFTTEADIDFATEQITDIVTRLRQ